MNPKGILWASFFINAFSFFFTIRWRSALWMFGIFVAVGMVGNYLMQIEALPQILEFCLVIVFLFLPVIINGVLLAIHESELNHADASNGEKAYDLAANIKDLVS